MFNNDLLAKYQLDPNEFEQTGLKWDDLNEINADYSNRKNELSSIAQLISNQLQELPDVHSVRYRVKDSEHLIVKIIRKCIKSPNRKITLSNYTEEITDLIGVRALHLFKSNWAYINQFIGKTWDLNEQPKAYIRAGDSKEANEVFIAAGFSIEDHISGYRSLHYNIKTQPGKTPYIAELQVRTIFEEGWSEIDHTIRYPHNTKNGIINEFLMIFNRMSGSADEMGSFIQLLHNDLQQRENEVTLLKERIDRLEMKPEEKVQLKESVDHILPSSLKSLNHIYIDYANLYLDFPLSQSFEDLKLLDDYKNSDQGFSENLLRIIKSSNKKGKNS